jgi:hypothetical protein
MKKKREYVKPNTTEMVKNKKDIYYLTNKKNNFLTPNHEKRERFEFVFFHFLGVKI